MSNGVGFVPEQVLKGEWELEKEGGLLQQGDQLKESGDPGEMREQLDGGKSPKDLEGPSDAIFTGHASSYLDLGR